MRVQRNSKKKFIVFFDIHRWKAKHKYRNRHFESLLELWQHWSHCTAAIASSNITSVFQKLFFFFFLATQYLAVAYIIMLSQNLLLRELPRHFFFIRNLYIMMLRLFFRVLLLSGNPDEWTIPFCLHLRISIAWVLPV